MICASCRGEAPPTASHCPRCGQPLSAPLTAAVAPSAADSPPAAPLFVVGPPLAGAWPRYWARSLDLLLPILLLTVVLAVAAPSLLTPFARVPQGLQTLFGGVVLVPLALLLDALIYTLCGNTLAKWLAGVRVADLDGHKLSAARYLERNLGVFVRGLGLGIPLITLFTLIYNCSRVSEGALTAWDRSTDSRAYRVAGGLPRTIVTAIVYLALGFAVAAVNLFLTVASPEQQLAMFVAVANRSAPTMVNDHMRLERVTLVPGRVMQYDFTVLEAAAAAKVARRDPQLIRSALAQKLCDDLHTVFYDLDGSVRWRYLDAHAEPLVTVDLSRRDCEPGH